MELEFNSTRVVSMGEFWLYIKKSDPQKKMQVNFVHHNQYAEDSKSLLISKVAIYFLKEYVNK